MVSEKIANNKNFIHTQDDMVKMVENNIPQEAVLYDLGELF